MRTADVWARALFSSLARFRGDITRPLLLTKRKNKAGEGEGDGRELEREREWRDENEGIDRSVVRNQQLVATHVQHGRTRAPRFSNY